MAKKEINPERAMYVIAIVILVVTFVLRLIF